jgi:putative acetyltransferase
MRVHIRPETAADSAAIHAVTVAAFEKAPHASHTEQFIVKALRAANALSLSLVAEIDGEIVGHVAVSRVSISDGATGWFGLGPISVVPRLQGQGIGNRLMCEVVGQLEDDGADGCVLLGDPAYYSRFGFKPEPGLVLPGAPPEYFQALAFSQHLPQGIVTYHDAFNARG